MSKETKLKEKSTRVKRKRLEKAGPLFIDDSNFEQGYHYRIVNVSAGEVARRQKMGYEVVEDKDLVVGDQTAAQSSKLGSAVILDVGRTSELKGVLIRIPNDEYQEILDELHELTVKKEQALFEEPMKDLTTAEKNSLYGGVKINQG
ncbi:MAG TPA: hypothetical protein VGF75_04660 [Candidatus Saccharimonadales bacterium]|jgi:hypothetical protein